MSILIDVPLKPRKQGPLEARLRAAVKARIQKRGDQTELAKALGIDDYFFTRYLKETQHANLDTSVKLAKHFRFSLRMLLGLDPYPDHDEEMEALAAKWHAAPPAIREAVWRVLDFASAPPTIAPQLPQPRVSARPAKGRKNRSAS